MLSLAVKNLDNIFIINRTYYYYYYYFVLSPNITMDSTFNTLQRRMSDISSYVVGKKDGLSKMSSRKKKTIVIVVAVVGSCIVIPSLIDSYS